jgi:hypothetical protein
MAIVEQTPKTVTQILPYEIECPRCLGYMELRLDFETPFYNCEECDFVLETTKKS